MRRNFDASENGEKGKEEKSDPRRHIWDFPMSGSSEYERNCFSFFMRYGCRLNQECYL